MLSLDGTRAIASFDRKQTNELDRWSAKRAAYLAMVNMQTAYGATGRRGSGGLWGWSSQFEIITYIPYAGIYRSFYGCTSGTIAASSPASTTQSSVSSAPISRDSGSADGRSR